MNAAGRLAVFCAGLAVAFVAAAVVADTAAKGRVDVSSDAPPGHGAMTEQASSEAATPVVSAGLSLGTDGYVLTAAFVVDNTGESNSTAAEAARWRPSRRTLPIFDVDQNPERSCTP